jgi:hypothetical protein
VTTYIHAPHWDDLPRGSLDEEAARHTPEQPNLQSAGSGSTLHDMSEVDAKIAAAEARTDTKFAEMMGELKLISYTTRGLKTTIITTGIATVIGLGALTIGVMAYGGQMFGLGLDTDEIVQRAAEAAGKQSAAELAFLREQIEQTNSQLGALIEAYGGKPPEPPAPQPESPLPGPEAPSPQPEGRTFPMPQR